MTFLGVGRSFNFLHLCVCTFSVVCSQLLITNLSLYLNNLEYSRYSILEYSRFSILEYSRYSILEYSRYSILKYSRYSKTETFHIKNREHTTDKQTNTHTKVHIELLRNKNEIVNKIK